MGNRVGTVDQTGLAPDVLLVIVLVLMPRGGKLQGRPPLALPPGSELQFPGTPTQLVCGFLRATGAVPTGKCS